MHIPRKITVALLAGVSIAGLAGASAASLGGVTSSQIGTSSGSVGSCDTDGVAVGYSTGYSGGAFVVTGLNFSGVNSACNGQNASIVLKDVNGGSIGSQSASNISVSNTGTFSVSLTNAVDAATLEGITVIISK